MISGFIDGDLSVKENDNVEAHLLICQGCAKLHEEFASLSGLYDNAFAEDSIPPNSQALWCRINNIIEAEIEETKEPVEVVEVVEVKRGFFAGSLNFSAAQFLASIVSVAIVSSLLTFVAFRNLYSTDTSLTGYEAEPSVFEKVLAQLGIADTPAEKAQRRLKERKSAIDYWTQRVGKRRVEWDTDTRVTFDRNMDVIDKALKQYTLILSENPQDEISTEMLDSALNEKMELLREFSEL